MLYVNYISIFEKKEWKFCSDHKNQFCSPSHPWYHYAFSFCIYSETVISLCNTRSREMEKDAFHVGMVSPLRKGRERMRTGCFNHSSSSPAVLAGAELVLKTPKDNWPQQDLFPPDVQPVKPTWKMPWFLYLQNTYFAYFTTCQITTLVL